LSKIVSEKTHSLLVVAASENCCRTVYRIVYISAAITTMRFSLLHTNLLGWAIRDSISGRGKATFLRNVPTSYWSTHHLACTNTDGSKHRLSVARNANTCSLTNRRQFDRCTPELTALSCVRNGASS